MTALFEKHRQVGSPALAPADVEFESSRKGSDSALTIGLVNNMPDSALQATERQFIRLLEAASGNRRVRFHCFSLPSIKRSSPAKSRVDTYYRDIADLDRLRIDGLIVTGAEPNAATLIEEPFWRDISKIVDWAKTNTRSTIWSCLAAHAAVLHCDGIERKKLKEKCSGIYDCATVADDWLTADMPSTLKVAHSRFNELHANDLVARGYQLLTESREAGVDMFAKQQLQSRFIFLQGHPEYDTLSLQREYLRDITRYLSGKRDIYPAIPAGYFELETEVELAGFQKYAMAERKLPLTAELPTLRVRPHPAQEAAPIAIFRNWLGFLSRSPQ
jgi:homoserine O-succinyltransferase